MNTKQLFELVSTSALIVLFSGKCLAVDDKYVPQQQYKSDFEESVEQEGRDAKKDPPYTPPNPHEGRYQVPGEDVSVGGQGDPPSVDVKTTY